MNTTCVNRHQTCGHTWKTVNGKRTSHTHSKKTSTEYTAPSECQCNQDDRQQAHGHRDTETLTEPHLTSGAVSVFTKQLHFNAPGHGTLLTACPAALAVYYTQERAEGRGRERGERGGGRAHPIAQARPVMDTFTGQTPQQTLPKLSLVRAVHNLKGDLRSHSTKLPSPPGTHHAGFLHLMVSDPFPRVDMASFPTGCTVGKPAKAKQR